MEADLKNEIIRDYSTAYTVRTDIRLLKRYNKRNSNGCYYTRIYPVLITTDSTRLTSYELFSPGSIELALDKLTTLLETIPDEYIKNTKAGKMLLEMIAYFEGR